MTQVGTGSGHAGAPPAPPSEAQAKPAPVRVRCRKALPDDADRLAGLLAQRFPKRPRAYWDQALIRLADHNARQGFAHLGYILEAGDAIVGALLTIMARIGEAEASHLRCNLSSWCVEDAFRSYSPLLVNAATRDKAVTYVNISSERATRPTIEAQGFQRYAAGLFFAVPMLCARPAHPLRVRAGSNVPDTARESDRALLRDHAAFGCLTYWVETPGRAIPLVFTVWRPKGLLPTAHLVYGPEPDAFGGVARAVWATLAKRGLFVISLDANTAPEGLVGRHVQAMTRYAKGPNPPPVGDLAYTEWPLFGT